MWFESLFVVQYSRSVLHRFLSSAHLVYHTYPPFVNTFFKVFLSFFAFGTFVYYKPINHALLVQFYYRFPRFIRFSTPFLPLSPYILFVLLSIFSKIFFDFFLLFLNYIPLFSSLKKISILFSVKTITDSEKTKK